MSLPVSQNWYGTQVLSETVYEAGIWPGGHRAIKAFPMVFGGENPEFVLFRYTIKRTSAVRAIQMFFFIYLYRGKRLRRSWDGNSSVLAGAPGWAHPVLSTIGA